MCVSDYPTDSPFFRRPTQVFLLCDSKFFLLGIHIEKQEASRPNSSAIYDWFLATKKITKSVQTVLKITHLASKEVLSGHYISKILGLCND